MFRTIARTSARFGVSAVRSQARATRLASTYTTAVPSASTYTRESIAPLKINSNGSEHLYAIFKLHNMPYMVTKGDKVYLPFKLKNAEVGDQLFLNNVTTIGSPDYTLNDDAGIPSDLYSLKANVIEVTREPYYEVVKKKQRCRRFKRIPVQPFQTVLRIEELKLR